jgi:PAS domain S-box-containing protein
MSVGKPLVQIGLLGEAVEGAPFAVLVAEENGRLVAVNQCACRLFGHSRDELLQLTMADVLGGPDVESHYLSEHEATVDARRKDGTTFRFAYRAGETTIVGLRYYVSVGWPVE